MKAVSLPIHVVVIIVIAVIVLLAIIAVFFSVYAPSSGSTTLQAATGATCKRINPSLCNNGRYNNFQPRAPVYDFDANRDGKINEFNPDGSALTSYCIDDNLETLCGFYYGCDLPGKTFSSVCGPPSTDLFITNDEEGQEWYKCCVRRVCGCS